MREVEFTGANIDEALKRASDELKLTADNIEFDIVSLGSKGLLGIGKKPAKIKVYLKDVKEPFGKEKKRERRRERKPEKRERRPDKREKKAKGTRREEPVMASSTEEPVNIPDEGVKKIADFVAVVARSIDEDAQVSAEVKNNKLNITLVTQNSGKIIGKGGRIINSIEYLSIKYARKIFEDKVKVVIQVDKPGV